MSEGYRLTPEDMAAEVTALAALGDRADGLVTSAGELAQRLPKLGTAPPALHLANQLRIAAGDAGLTGEVKAASEDLARFHRRLSNAIIRYVGQDDTVARSLDQL